MEDDRVSMLEAQLAQAKLIAEEADKKYEEVKSCHADWAHVGKIKSIQTKITRFIHAGIKKKLFAL